VLLPLQFHDASAVPPDWLAEAVLEIVDSYETQKLEGHWRHCGVLYRDNLVRVVVNVPDLVDNRDCMRQFRDRWQTRLRLLELWMVSHRIEVE
jgi:hypothetical protein